MQTIVVYPGRFQPFHKGHKASYDWLANKFGADNVFIATSAVQAPMTSPFNYSDKVAMITKLGIPSSKIIQVRNPYQAQEITKDIADPENTALVFAVSEKDMEGEEARFKFGVKKDGSPSYMQPYPENGKLKPLTKHAYVTVTPTVNFKVKGRDANSASEIRKLYIDGNDNDKIQIITDMYGEPDTQLKDIFDQRLLPAQKAKEVVLQHPPIDDNAMSASTPIQRESKQKLKKLLESALLAEQRVRDAYAPFTEDLADNYICEKTNHVSYWPSKRI